MEFLSRQEELRFKSIEKAIGKWHKLSLSYRIPSLKMIAFLAGLRRVYKYEVDTILKGGN